MIDPARRWLRDRPALRDFAVALACFVLAGPVTALASGEWQDVLGQRLALLALSCAPLTVLRRWPLPVVAATTAADAIRIALVPLSGPTLATAFALYVFALRTDRRTAWCTGALAASVITAASLVFAPSGGPHPELLGHIAFILLAVALGDATRSRRELIASATRRADRAERTREEEARRQVTEERVRIARELHDVVAHHITLVNAQAGVAHHLMRTNPEHAYQALERIRDTSRTALDELRATVGLLRVGDDPDELPRVPAPSLGDLETLLDSFRHTGLPVELSGAAISPDLAPMTEVTAYRIIQEALTNTHKHAGPATAQVVLDIRADTLRVTITDDGHGVRGPQAPPGTGTLPRAGHGMIGMRERAKAVGGTLTVGPHPAGGFRVVAELPLHYARKGLS
ncbi:sensor histidine kinase [Streptomyces sp. AP-93]|uniref:sensor histidine kinase n=1 Tax=Streptomyces sp. AP-93 TaxID=2929048 RepID=UPI001FB01645|nr:sensor histidine kinase [Streptomyces sp. AP-93]MCJ0872612.1 sensor histidine kinase [Streptomyces sp. AP-93]